MRWATAKPKEGSIRTIKKFAWFPRTLTEQDYAVWLEYYTAEEEYTKVLEDYNGVVGWVISWVERRSWLG